MLAYLFSWAKYARLRKGSDFPSQDSIPLSQLSNAPTLQAKAKANPDDSHWRARSYWLFLCYFLHGFLIALHVILLVAAASNHAEHQIRVPLAYAPGLWPTGLRAGLQAFYTLYTALLVFVTQKLMLSAVFSRTKKLTHIHDICGAWAGLGAALSALWQQTKVASSVLPIALVTVYFTCIAVLHVTSSTLMQFQWIFGYTPGGAERMWPNASVDLGSVDWTAITPLVPFLEIFYPSETFGLGNNTLYDISAFQPFAFSGLAVNATTLSANCGLLTNLSIDALENNTWAVHASMSDLDSINITVSYAPLLNEIWSPPSIQCSEPICLTFILYLVSAEMEVDDSVGSLTDHVYINKTYYSDGITQNFSTPIYFVACSLNATNHTIVLEGPSGFPLSPSKQSVDVAWSAFSPAGDLNLTSVISDAMRSANSLPSSPYCQPIMSDPTLWANITVFNAYMRTTLGMGVSPCFGTPVPQYASAPLSLTRSQFESTVSLIAAELIWLAGQLGKALGGFDREMLDNTWLQPNSLYCLNINTLPVVFSLCSSVILLVLVLCVLWQHTPTVVSSVGVLEIMWFGSRSRLLRDHISNVQTKSLDVLQENNDLHIVTTLRDRESHPKTLGLPESDSGNLRSTLNVSQRTRHWCYALHVVLVGLHVVLLALLVHHPEESIVILYDSLDTLTIGLSALLQAIYMLYSALLVLLMQRLALFKIVNERQKLTTVHDVSGAWTGIGAASFIFWKQHRRSSSPREIMAVVAYLAMMLVLHIASSSVMQWKEYEITTLESTNVQMYLAMPDSTVNISQLGWTEIFPVLRLVQDAHLITVGFGNSTLYDVLTPLSETVLDSVNATTFTAQCGLLSNLTLSAYQNSEGEYQISFENGASFLESPIWKDVVHVIMPTTECIACPQTLFYMITTGIRMDKSIQGSVAVELNWTYVPLGGNAQTSTTLTYIAACSLSAQTILVSEINDPTANQTLQPSSTSWSVWSPGNATNLSVGMTTALSKDVTSSFPMFFQGNSSANFTDMDSYIMSLLGLNLTYANETSVSQSSANSSVILEPWQLENAIAQTAAMFLWTAGQVGESGGGFQHLVGEAQAGVVILTGWRLHANTEPILFASVASFLSLVLSIIIVGKGPSRKHCPTSISGTSVLECLWLEARSELLHSRLRMIEEPRLDVLRAAGMFDICLGDIGGSSYAEVEQPILEATDE